MIFSFVYLIQGQGGPYCEFNVTEIGTLTCMYLVNGKEH